MLVAASSSSSSSSSSASIADLSPSTISTNQPSNHGATQYPHTAYLVAGTQADSPTNNFIYVMKVTDLHRTKHDDPDNSDDDSDDDDDLDDDPIVEARQIKHHGGVNRLKVRASACLLPCDCV